MSDRTLDDATLLHLASLAQLTLHASELPALRAQLGTILSYAAKLQEVDVSGVDAYTHAAEGAASPRADEIRPSLSPEEALRTAPEAFAGLFRVPRVLSG